MRKIFSALVTGVIYLAGMTLPGSAIAAQIINDIGDPLDLTLNAGKLISLEKPAASVFVGNPELADVHVQSPTIIYIFAKKPGRTNLFALDGDGKVLLNSPVDIKHDVRSLEAALKNLDPRLNLKAQSLQDGIILTGRAPSANIAEDARRLTSLYVSEGNIFNRIIVEGSNQVNLRVQIAEVARSVTKQLGVNWENLFTVDNFTFGLATGRDVLPLPIARAGDQSLGFLGFDDGQTNIGAAIDALEEEGLVTVLAQPNLTALSGESATFLAGGEFPVPVPQDDGAIGIEYRDFGVSLAFTPTVLANDRINLQVNPEVSQLSSASAINVNGIFIQSLTTRRAETTVELASGQSFVLGGLLNNDTDNSITKTPLLGDLPIIGSLFRSTSFQKNETELVIIVTPYLVKPVNSRVALPTDGFVPPNNKDLYMDGNNFRPSIKEGALPQSAPSSAAAEKPVKLVGPAGFIME